MGKPMRLPNGFGNINKLPGNRRNPYRARVFEGYTNEGKQIYKTIGYYQKYDMALTALVDYHRNPLDFKEDISFAELYKKWSVIKFEKIAKISHGKYVAAYKVCAPLYNMQMKDIKFRHMQNVIDTCGKNQPTLELVKTLLSQMFEYAVKTDIISKDADKTEFLDIGKSKESTRHAKFTDAELNTLWEHSDNEYVQVILMIIYSGARPGEMLGLKKENVNLQEGYFSVTHGKNKNAMRTVPIHHRTLPFFQNWMNKSEGEYLVTDTLGRIFSTRAGYQNFVRLYWTPTLSDLGILNQYNTNQEHAMHDTRYTFASMWAEKKLNEMYRRKIQGHSGKGIGEQVYTHIDISYLKEELDKI